VLSRWFDKKQDSGSTASVTGVTGPRVPRHSGGWGVLRKRLEGESGLRVIDTGYTSPANINYLTGLGHSVFLADLVHDACSGNWQSGTDEEGKPIWNVEGFLEQALNFAGRTFDVVLLWTALDYLPEPLVAPVVGHLHAAMNPGGASISPPATMSRCSWRRTFPFGGPLRTAASSGCLPAGRGTGNFWPRTASLRSL